MASGAHDGTRAFIGRKFREFPPGPAPLFSRALASALSTKTSTPPLGSCQLLMKVKPARNIANENIPMPVHWQLSQRKLGGRFLKQEIGLQTRKQLEKARRPRLPVFFVFESLSGFTFRRVDSAASFVLQVASALKQLEASKGSN